jgi:hypothetical protein
MKPLRRFVLWLPSLGGLIALALAAGASAKGW